MSKHLYELLNEVETDFDCYTQTPLTPLEKKQMEHRIRKKLHHNKSHKSIKIACAIACCSILFLGVFHEEVYATILQAQNKLSVMLGITKDLSPYEKVINQTITKNGISLTLNSVILNNDQLIISVTETQETPISDQSTITGTVSIDGEINHNGGVGASNRIDNYTIEHIMELELGTDFDVNQTREFHLIFENYDTSLDKKGQVWEYKFFADGVQLSSDTKKTPLAVSFTLPNNTIVTLSEFVTNALGDKIYFTFNGPNSYNIVLRGMDNQNHPVEFYLSHSNETGGRFDLDMLDYEPTNDVISYTLTPYAVEFPKESGRMSNDFKPIGEAFTVQIP